MRINPCSNGEILFEGKRISGKISREEDRNVVRNIQMIFQDPAASLNERATIEYCISEGLYNFHLYKDEEERIAKVDQALKDVGLLPEHKSRYPHEFSGGQRQRVGIARAMIMDPKLIVADEPISALDVSIRAQVLNLMNKLKAEKNLTYLFIAHDLSVVRFIADRIAVIHLGEIVEIADSETLFQCPLHPYTISLLSAVPMPDPVVERTRRAIVYDPSKLDQSGALRSLREIRPGHFVFCHGQRDGRLREEARRDRERKESVKDVGNKKRRRHIYGSKEERIVERRLSSFFLVRLVRLKGLLRRVAARAAHHIAADVKVAVEIERVDNTRDEQDRRDDRQTVGENEQPLRRGHDHARKRIQKRYGNVREQRLRLDILEAFFQFLHWACSRKLERFVFLYFTRKNRPVNKNGADRMMI